MDRLQRVLPAAPKRRAQVRWLGGTFEASDLAGFHVYGSDQPNGPIDFTTPLETITAYPGGIPTDGAGMGGFGLGGFGLASGAYSWVSKSLDAGVWTFAIKPFDKAGNEGPAQTGAVTIFAPPQEPAPFPGTPIRLKYAYSSISHQGTLNWNASPS